jgi:hypothetical protein
MKYGRGRRMSSKRLESLEFDKKKALLCLKWMITFQIDGHWGAGDAHLFMLQLLIGLDPEDDRISKLYERLSSRAKLFQSDIGETTVTGLKYNEKMYAEDVYRDEGKEEAEYYEQEIIKRYGKEFFDKLLDAFLDWV